MGRGIGQRGRGLLAALAEGPAGQYVPLHELSEPDVLSESCDKTNARSALHLLERRGLVDTIRDTDPDRRVTTSTIMSGVTRDLPLTTDHPLVVRDMGRPHPRGQGVAWSRGGPDPSDPDHGALLTRQEPGPVSARSTGRQSRSSPVERRCPWSGMGQTAVDTRSRGADRRDGGASWWPSR